MYEDLLKCKLSSLTVRFNPYMSKDSIELIKTDTISQIEKNLPYSKIKVIDYDGCTRFLFWATDEDLARINQSLRIANEE